MKRRTLLLLILILLVVGVFAWQYIAFIRLHAALDRQTSDIAARYTSIVQADLLPLQTAHTLNETETKLLPKITHTTDALQGKGLSVEEKVQLISDLQIAITRFSTLAADSKDMSTDPLFAQLQTEMGERGSVRVQLETYNATASQWNHGIQTEIGSLTNRIGGSNRSILPYLRFDGEQEFVPVIRM